MSNFTFKLNLDACADSHAPAKRTHLPRKTTFLWVVWGECHVREALANARWFGRLHRNVFSNLEVKVIIIGSSGLPVQAIDACRKAGVQVVELVDVTRPSNTALFDLDRVRYACAIDGPVMYMDSDLYALRPIDIMSLYGNKVMTFGMGPAMIASDTIYVHKLVESIVEAPSAIYYRDIGMDTSDYEAENRWPWIRVNLGMFWLDHGSNNQVFLDRFEDLNIRMAFTKHFGVGEMIFTAMHNASMIPGHVFNWHNGWNKIWPWIVDHDLKIAIQIEGDEIVQLRPSSRHDVVHVIGSKPQRICMVVANDGSVMMQLGMIPKANGIPGDFDRL